MALKKTLLAAIIAAAYSSAPDRLTFVGNRQSIPNGTITVASGKEFETTEVSFKAPTYSTNGFVMAFPAFYASSGATVEKTTSAIAITSAYMRIAGVLYPITFVGAATTGTVPSGGYLLGYCTATIPANATYTVVTSRQSTIGDTIPSMYYGQSALGDRQNQGSTSQEGGIAGNTLTNAAYSARLYGPLCMAGMGWAAGGRLPVPLITGDSRAWGVAQNNVFESPTGVFGFIATALNDSVSSTRYSYGNFAVPGTNLTNFSATSGQFAVRGQLLADLNYPFTCIINEMGFNNGLGSSATWQGLHVTGTNYLKTLGARPIINTSIFDFTTLTDATTVWTDTASQTAQTDQLAAINTYLAGLPNGASGFINMDGVFLDGSKKWLVPAYSSTLSAGVSSGQTISLAAKPADGACLVVEPGNANYEFVRVRSSTGAGPYTVTLTAASVISKTHSSGATVKETNTADGIHAEAPITIAAAATVVAAKNAGVIL